MSNKALVAVCDILGFSNLITHTSFYELENIHIPNLEKIYQGSIPGVKKDSETQDNDKVGFAIFSDTILVYSLTDDEYGLNAVKNTVLRLVAQYFRWPHYRMRAGIDYGEFYADPEHNIYVGKALIEAHALEKKQEWCGVAFTKAAEKRINEIIPINRQFSLISYDVPVKNNTFEKHLVINWTRNHAPIDQEYGWLRKDDDLPNSLPDEEKKKIDKKLENTEKFHADVCVVCKTHKNKQKIEI